MGTKVFFLIRHGETIENASGLVQGQLQGRLSEEGIRQSRLIAGRLSGNRFDAVYSSDLHRAQQTARIIMEGRAGPGIVVEARLREQSFGAYEGGLIAALLKDMESDRSDFATFIPAGGEDPTDFYRRVTGFLNELRARTDKSVLLVTHYGVINALLRSLIYNEAKGAADRIIGNGTLTILEIDQGGAANIRTLNDTLHF